MKNLTFDQNYYNAIIKDFGYNPLEFEPISFSLGKLSREDLQRLWLCHMNGNIFANSFQNGEKTIVTTGFGMSGVPHAGTLGQILRALRLQQSGIAVQIVLGDLDAYNGKNKDMDYVRNIADSYRNFILNLGFNPNAPNSLRSQYESLSTLRFSYLIGHYMNDKMFDVTEEDLHEYYSLSGKVDAEMSYRRKLSLNLMIADFLELLSDGGFDSMLVILGIDEHKYVNFGKETFEKVLLAHPNLFHGKNYSAMYSGVMKGFNGYPKMAKSFNGSGISVDMSAEEITSMIMNGETITPFPETNVVFQMISWASLYDNEQIKEAYKECFKQSKRWKEIKREYAIHLSEICLMWKNVYKGGTQ
jgi:tryptophanyl-tRNA synthetase